MLTSWSEVSTPAELSMKSVLIRPPRGGVLDPAALGQAEVAALADALGAQLAAVDADRVVGLVARLGVGLGAALDVGADAAVPEQVDRREQDRLHQLGRRHPLLPVRASMPEGLAHLRADRDRLGVRDQTPPPSEISEVS